MKNSSKKSFQRCSQILLSLVLLSFGVSSCNKDEDNGGNDPIITNDNVYFLDQESQSTLDSVDTDILYFSSLGPQIESLKTNDIVVSSITENAPNGFIRKVKKIILDNNNVILETEIASMNEAFCSFDFNWQEDKNTLGLRSFPVQKSKTNVVLYDKDQNPATNHDQVRVGVNYDYQATPIFHYTIEDCNVTKLKLGLTVEGSLELQGSFGANIGQVSISDDPLFPEIKLAQIVSPIPITINAVLRPRFNAEFYNEFDFNINETATRSYFIEYDGSKWTQKEEIDIQPFETPFNINVGLDAKTGVDFNIEFQLFDLSDLRSSIGVSSFVGAKSELDIINGEFEYEIKACAEALAKVVMKPFSYSLLDYERSFLEYCFYEQNGSFNNHCSDGELNFDEEDIDCGGAKCPPCPCEHPDLLGLESLYNNTNGQEWINNEGWLSNCDPCSWFGVTCVNDRAKTINLKNNNLTGELAPLLGQLSELTQLDLSDNNIEGNLSPSILAADKLVSIQLQYNQLDGEIPQNINDLQSLTLLNLENNKISGKLPEALNEIQTLQRLNLKNNNLSGCIENSFSVLCSRDVDFSENVGLPFNGDFERICANEIGFCSGCLDSEAHNYNPFATSGNDSDCETCDDGIQNGDEEDVDCGGEKCEECDLCYDDILVDDRDENEYKIRKFGGFWFFLENLRYDSPNSRCFKGLADNCELGRIYSVTETVGGCDISVDGFNNFIQGVCPNGWHTPTRAEMLEIMKSVTTVEEFGYWELDPEFKYKSWKSDELVEEFHCLDSKTAIEVYTISDDSWSSGILRDDLVSFYTTTLSTENPDHNPAKNKRYFFRSWDAQFDYSVFIGLEPEWGAGACAPLTQYNPGIYSYQYQPCRCIKDY